MKNRRLVSVNGKAWEEIRNTLPSLSDAKRSVICSVALRESGIVNKLNPEFNDSKSDKMIKKIMKGMLYD